MTDKAKLLAFAPLAMVAGSASGKTVPITAARMVDVLTGRVIEQPIITVVDGRITATADRREVKFAPEAKLIDLCARTLLPRLIDMHVHLDSQADIGGYRGLEFSDSFWAMAAVGKAKAMLDAGFTTVRNAGSSNRKDVGLKQTIDNGYAAGPPIVPAGYALGATGGHQGRDPRRNRHHRTCVSGR